MATRFISRSKTLTLNRGFIHRSSESLRPLHSLTTPVDLGAYRPSDSRSAASKFAPRPDPAAAVSSPAVSSILGSKKVLGYEKTLHRWFSANAQGKLTSQLLPTEKATEEAIKVVGGVVEHAGHDVTCFSPLEAISSKPRISSLGNESLKIKRTELSQKITFALIPALVLISKSSLTTSLLVLSVYWQIHGFFKEIFLDYVHQEVTRNWVLVYFHVLLLILIKDTFLDFGLAKFGQSSTTTAVHVSSSTMGSRVRQLYSKKKSRASDADRSSNEMSMYLATPWPFTDDDLENESYDVLAWWKQYRSEHPILSMMARELLAFPVSTVASESTFSAGSRLLSKRRTKLKPDILEAMICAKDWFRAEDRTQNLQILSEDSDMEGEGEEEAAGSA